MGKQQSGKDALACLRAAKLPEDRLLMEQARQVASQLIDRYTLDPGRVEPLAAGCPGQGRPAQAGLPPLPCRCPREGAGRCVDIVVAFHMVCTWDCRLLLSRCNCWLLCGTHAC